MGFKQINYLDVIKYKDPFSLFGEACIALADNNAKVSCLTLGWGSLGILYNKPCCTIFINEARDSRKTFTDSETFSVCFFDKKYDELLSNYYGRLSGRDIDKAHEGDFTLEYENNIPYFKEAELVIFCSKMAETKFDINKIKDIRTVNWYKRDGVHSIYFGQITKVLIKE